jgi:hypothetical protein
MTRAVEQEIDAFVVMQISGLLKESELDAAQAVAAKRLVAEGTIIC